MNKRRKQLALKLKLNVSLDQYSPYSESCLPKTMKLALEHKPFLLEKLRGINKAWSFRDRVLVWLAGHWSENVMKYYSGSSENMESMFKHHILEKFDDHLLSRVRKAFE